MPSSNHKKRTSVTKRRRRTSKSASTFKQKRKQSKYKTKKRKKVNASLPIKNWGWYFAVLLLVFLLGYGLGRYKVKSTLELHKRQSPPSIEVSKGKKEKKESSTPLSKHPKIKPHNKKVPTYQKKDPFSKAGTFHTKLAYRSYPPKLAIVIDDVHTKSQINKIKTLDIPITPSIFPPYTLSPHTPRLARSVVHYMVHLPMESGNAKYDRQSKTLKITDSEAVIQRRIKQIRRLFPRATFVNNHTGSRFTQDRRAMERLYRALKREGFAFIDSRTTPKSTVGTIAHRYGDDYVARDIFLDNTKEKHAIVQQLKKAVHLAKKNGYAIAIGHPYAVTLQTLKEAKPLLKEVEVVYIEKLFRR